MVKAKEGLRMVKKVVSFDKANDIITAHKGFSSDEKFKGNLVAGDLILDISTRQRVRGLEIMNATDFLKDLGVEKKLMDNLTDATFNSVIKPSGIVITLILKAEKIEREIPLKVTVPVENSILN